MNELNVYTTFFHGVLKNIQNLHEQLSQISHSFPMNEKELQNLNLLKFWVKDLDSVASYVQGKLRQD